MALFARRRKLTLWAKVAGFFWPASGFRRSSAYIVRRLKRLPATPHAIAAGFASGAAVSFLPAIGFHFLLGFALAWLVRGNMIAAAFGTVVGNPFTFPFIFTAAYRVGDAILSVGEVDHPPPEVFEAEAEALLEQGIAVEHLSLGTLETLWPMLKVMWVGGLPIATVAFFVFYGLMRLALSGAGGRRRQPAPTPVRAAA